MHSHSRSSQLLAVGLSCLAGFIDSIGFLSLGGYFVSFMSGNSTRFGVGVADAIPLQRALLPLGIIFIFVLGVAAGKLIRHFQSARPFSSVLIFMTSCLLAAAISQSAGLIMPALPLAVIAMGAANNVFLREGEVAIGVTYMTGTLVKMGQKIAGRLLGEPGSEWIPYLLLWLGLITGAIGGAAAYAYMALSSLWVGAVFCGVMALYAYKLDKSV